MRQATSKEQHQWDELIRQNPDGGDFMQSRIWGNFKARWGWQPHRFLYQLRSGPQVAVQWLMRPTPLGKVWLCPHGPGVATETDLLDIAQQTRQFNLPGIWARLEPQLPETHVQLKSLAQTGLRKSNREVTTKSTIFVDVSQTEESLWQSFSQKGRYNVRKAEQAGVSVQAESASIDNFWHMYSLIKEAESYGRFGLRPHHYYEDYWWDSTHSGQGQLFLARRDNQVIAGAFIPIFGGKAWYKDGGSRREFRRYNAPYLLQWEIMRWLHRQGVHSYDLVGVPDPSQVRTGDRRDGLYEFKSRFNTHITEFVGAYDLPLSGWRYELWPKLGERAAARVAMERPERFLY